MAEVKMVPWSGSLPPSQVEVEARLHQEGYDAFRWHDVPGSTYPRHRHSHDECIWVLQGEISFNVDGQLFSLKPGDRIYLPARTAHTADVPSTTSVTYLVGQRR